MRGHAIRGAVVLVLLVAAGVAAMMALAARSSSTKATVDLDKTSPVGAVLVASNGRTLYRYTVDGKGVNRCSKDPACNPYWPPLTVKGGTKPTAGSGVSSNLLGTIAAAHGLQQVTYAGYPLYYFSGDKKAGQVNGQGFGKKWYVVSTTGALVKHASSASKSGSSSGGGTTTSSGGGAWG
jgi:predicted lipoprotein with Yx(FWY)xxD motif